jgi:hypothetical protein
MPVLDAPEKTAKTPSPSGFCPYRALWEKCRVRAVAVQCPKCQGEDCVQIEINLQAETVQFASCRVCEAKWWEHDGGNIDLSDVLTLAAQADQI